MTHRITDLRVEPVTYFTQGQRVVGTNVMFKVDGRPMSSRLPWVESPQRAQERIETLIAAELIK